MWHSGDVAVQAISFICYDASMAAANEKLATAFDSCKYKQYFGFTKYNFEVQLKF